MCISFKGLVLRSPLSWIAFVIQTSVYPECPLKHLETAWVCQALQILAVKHRAMVAKEFITDFLRRHHCTLWIMVAALSSWPREA